MNVFLSVTQVKETFSLSHPYEVVSVFVLLGHLANKRHLAYYATFLPNLHVLKIFF